MGCATTTVKIASIIFNILLAIISIAGIILISFNPDYFREELSIGYYTTLSLCVIFAFLGIFATIRESVCLTATCAVFLLALTLINIAIAIVGINSGEHNGVEVVNKAWETNAMDELQINHDCCGKTSSNDYVLMNKPIPDSCYADQDKSDIHNLFTEGCSEKMVTYYEEESYRFAILSWICVAFEFFGFLLATFLVINFRNTQRRMQF
ncbi:protein late bloomer [Lucilia sericata]|uniref:protein late bloomer n=1 Tax=Lucilia sericata TaxID=13632 RepID=UPI0018A8727D|nr:protein late bloomer [Lucilia sericata]